MGEWVLLGLGTLFFYGCIHGILYLLRLRRRGLIRAKEFADPQGRFFFRYPAEWELKENGEKIVFITHDHDGRVEIAIVPKQSPSPGPAEFLENWRVRSQMEFDDGEIHSFETNGRPGAYLESRAARGTERLYLQEWAVDAEDCRFLLSYRCSVLYGLVDGHFIDQLMRSLKLSASRSASARSSD